MRKPFPPPLMLLVLIVLLFAAGCRIPPDVSNRGTEIKLAFAPDPPTIGDTVAVITVVRDDTPLADVPISLRGVVNTVGIPPQNGAGITDADGHTIIPLEWTYGGDWTMTVTAALPNGKTMTQEFRIYVPDAPA